MDIANVIGSIAAILTTISFVPQAYRVIKYRDTEAISLMMYILFTSGVFLWMIYGFMTHSYPIIIANIITLLLAMVILVTKLRS